MKTTDAQEFYIESSKLRKELSDLKDEKKTTPIITARYDAIIQRENAIRIRLMAIKIRWENLGNLTKYAMPADFKEYPKFK